MYNRLKPMLFSIIFILQNNHYFYSVFTSQTPIRHPELKKSELKRCFKQSGNQSRLAPVNLLKTAWLCGSKGSSPITRTKRKTADIFSGFFFCIIIYSLLFIIYYLKTKTVQKRTVLFLFRVSFLFISFP